LDLEHADSPVAWDCTVGASVDLAVASWARTTAPTVIELVTQTGEFAVHFGPDDPGGLAGWHAIHGEIVGFGDDEYLDELIPWWVDHPVLPRIRDPLLAELDRPFCNGVKWVVGSFVDHDIAEVRVNGRIAHRATNALAALDRPRCRDREARGGYVKSYVLPIRPA
jgi:hypothetical protein